MSSKRINYYTENRYTGDIVYPYINGEEDRYRKTAEGVVLIHKDPKGKITKRLLAENEFSLSDFDRIKTISDEDYCERNKGDVLEHRHTVPLTDAQESRCCARVPSAEEVFLKSLEYESNRDPRTMENAVSIMNEGLSKTQKRRFMMYSHEGLSMREIAKQEGVDWTAIRESILSANKKIKKVLKKREKTPPQKGERLYISEGQERGKAQATREP